LDSITELTDKLGQATARIDAAVKVMEESKATDSARWETADAERKAAATELGEIKEKIAKAEREKATDDALEEWKALKASTRTPSKAALVGPGNAPLDGYQPGMFISSVIGAHSTDPAVQAQAKANLQSLGSWYMEKPEESKATLGLTDSTGGFIIPNNIVEALEKPKVQRNLARELVTVVNGLSGTGVDQPYRGTAPARATVIAPGSTKENLDLTYANYTATLYTIARIYDLSTRFVRTSAGAAEADVLGELQSAFALGEAYYIYSGAGTTEPTGILTALAAAAPTFDATFTGATTLVGSVVAGVGAAAAKLATVNRTPSAGVMNAADYWTMFTQGADAAGFYAGGAYRGGLDITPDGQARIWGIPIYPDNNISSDTLLLGDFKSAKLYVGMGYRVDTSTEAGTRWDNNLIGFRAEEDIAFDARTAVATGNFVRITNLVP
jgi:HK97 family phage major capsid protein